MPTTPADLLSELLVELETRKIRLQAEDGRLRFFAPQGAMTPAIRAQLATHKDALLEYLQTSGQPAAETAPPPIPTVPRHTPLPLSFAQERLWFLDQVEGPSPTYNMYDAWRLRGRLDGAALQAALGDIVARHESLRTTFVVDAAGGPPRQHIHPPGPVALDLRDLRAQPDSTREAAAVDLANEIARAPFALASGPLIRARLIRLEDDAALFVLVVHHIVYDRTSADIVRRELEAAYVARRAGRVPEFPPLPAQYADYAAWERSANSVESAGKALDFWKTCLAGAPAVLELPTDHPRPTQQSYRGAQVRTLLPPAQLADLRELARRDQATLFHAALAAWAVVLQRYSGSQDIVIGTSATHRTRVELEPVVGFFVNMLPVRLAVDPAAPVREVVRRTRDAAVAAVSHGEVSFERIVRAVQAPRNPGVSPVFQVALSFLNDSGQAARFADLELTRMPLDVGAAKFDLTLWLAEKPDGLQATLEYATALFSTMRARRMLGHFARTVQSMIEAPDAPAASLRLLTDEEQAEIVVGWNATGREYPRDLCLHQLFERQARISPEATALAMGDRSLTYGELDQRAGALAAHLRTHGVGPNVLVGLCLERSFEMVVGMLGILKAGGAYVPIDPAYPADRVAFVLEDAAAPVLVTQRTLEPRLPATRAHRVFLDEPIPAAPTPAAPTPPGPEDLAYVLYTSGSTGKPKGVQIPHRAVVNFLESMRRAPGMRAVDTLLAVTTLSFDIAGLEIHLPLSTGARIVIAPQRLTMDGAALVRTIAAENVTVLQATPATFRLMLAAGWPGSPRLKVLCGGEALPADLASSLIPRCAELWNMYGPTETTIWSTCAHVTDARDIHIGRPIDNTDVYILDASGQPLPVGLPGELLIGGDGLARGYHNRPELTAERFIPHPFKAGQRVYRTGDLARWRADGNIDCLGRLDFQVKIRGFRIELGEIETRLSEHPGVAQNVVVAREDAPGDKRLIAYIVPRAGHTPTGSEIREHLRGRVPEYMVPAAVVALTALPLTPNGKIDRKALPAPTAASTPPTPAPATLPPSQEPAASIHAPDTITRLCSLFAEVLGTPVPSADANFFDLGGHSLSALTLVANINRQFHSDLAPVTLFDHPTVAGIARLLGARDGTATSADAAATEAETAARDAQVDRILTAITRRDSGRPPVSHCPHMRESWTARHLLAPLYATRRRSIRRLVTLAILKLEGGSPFTVTLRRLFAQHHDIHVGEFTGVRFDPVTLKPKTRIGRFSSIYHTANFQNANHPLNTVAMHGLFYHRKFGFSEGYELPRVQIEIGHDVWIGHDAKILYPTRRIGTGAVIAAGATVTEDVPPYAVVAGYPAKIVRYRFSRRTIDKLLESRWWEASLEDLYAARDQFMVPLEGDRIR